MKKKIITAILAASMTASLLTACGSKGSSEPAAVSTQAEASTQASASTQEAASDMPATESVADEAVLEIPVSIVNGTGVDIAELYTSGSGLDEWGEEFLEGEIMANGTYLELMMYVDPNNKKWDLMVKDTDGNPLEWYEIDLSGATEDGFVIELLWDGKKGTANLVSDMSQLEGDYTAAEGGSGEMVSDETFAALQEEFAVLTEVYNTVADVYNGSEIDDPEIKAAMDEAYDAINLVSELKQDELTEQEAVDLATNMMELAKGLQMIAEGITQ